MNHIPEHHLYPCKHMKRSSVDETVYHRWKQTVAVCTGRFRSLTYWWICLKQWMLMDWRTSLMSTAMTFSMEQSGRLIDQHSIHRNFWVSDLVARMVLTVEAWLGNSSAWQCVLLRTRRYFPDLEMPRTWFLTIEVYDSLFSHHCCQSFIYHQSAIRHNFDTICWHDNISVAKQYYDSTCFFLLFRYMSCQFNITTHSPSTISSQLWNMLSSRTPTWMQLRYDMQASYSLIKGIHSSPEGMAGHITESCCVK